MGDARLEDLGLIGDGATVALVGIGETAGWRAGQWGTRWLRLRVITGTLVPANYGNVPGAAAVRPGGTTATVRCRRPDYRNSPALSFRTRAQRQQRASAAVPAESSGSRRSLPGPRHGPDPVDRRR